MEREGPQPGRRMAALLRHLASTAQEAAAARARASDALERLLDVALDERGLAPLVEAITVAFPAVDCVGVLARAERGWEVRAGAGLSPGAGLVADAREGPLADLARAAHPLLVTAAGGAEPGPPFPPGTRAACVLPLRARDGALVGALLLGSRSAADLGPEELLAARVAAARAAHALDAARLELDLSRAEQAARRTAAFRDQILAIVGHDLRNPLGAIVMSAALLQKRGGLAGWQARTVDRVRGSAARMGRIISDLLSYTRTRLGEGIPIARAPSDLADVARRVIEELRAAHPDATVTVDVDGDAAGEWDGDRLEQVVSNLVSNAIDHGEMGEPVVVQVRGEIDAVRLEVSNRGEMPPAVLAHAFEAFHRGPEHTGRRASGLGLGLYIAREIVRRHGGDITVRSAEGETHTSVVLPRQVDPAAAASPP